MPEEKMRIEHDSMGEIAVPADKYWGAQTERSRRNFPAGAGHETMPEEILRAFAILKKAAAEANRALVPQRMTEEKCAAISRACDEILAGQLDGNFPLVVFQTGSGTQSNMNVNEVVANRGQRRRREKAAAPERRCEYVAVLKRHVPDGDAHCRRYRAGGKPSPGVR